MLAHQRGKGGPNRFDERNAAPLRANVCLIHRNENRTSLAQPAHPQARFAAIYQH
jgi:hypothetical protein